MADFSAQDTFDSRDIIARIDELESEVDGAEPTPEDESETVTTDDGVDVSEEFAELKILKAFAEEAKGYAPDWHHGAQFIADSHFTEYAEELAKDIGAVNSEDGWPLDHIDWEAAAAALKIDYSCLEFDGVEFWTRA